MCRGLASSTGHPVILLTGTPEARMYNRFGPAQPNGRFTAAFFTEWSGIECADAYWSQAVEARDQDGALVFTFDERATRKGLGNKFVEAVNASRGARFTQESAA